MNVRLASVCGALAVSVAIAAGASAKPADRAQCPLKTGLPSGGDVQWAFNQTGLPNGSHSGLRSSYTHGRGSWTAGRATGTVCSQDSPTTGSVLNLVLAIAGKAKLSPGISKFGLPGVGLILPMKVSASDDSACTAGTHGTVTLFASYHAIHRDSISLHFAGSCAHHNHRYTGSRVHVFIARHGAQVN